MGSLGVFALTFGGKVSILLRMIITKKVIYYW